MFLAIIVPPARRVRPVAITVGFAAALSCLFRWAPGLNRLGSGWAIILCAVAASAFSAWRFPVDMDGGEVQA